MIGDEKRRDELMRKLMASIGKRIKEEREKREWDTLELVIQSRVNQQTIYGIENNYGCNPNIKTLINIADALGMDLESMLKQVP